MTTNIKLIVTPDSVKDDGVPTVFINGKRLNGIQHVKFEWNTNDVNTIGNKRLMIEYYDTKEHLIKKVVFKNDEQ